jgi:hypothetical protein
MAVLWWCFLVEISRKINVFSDKDTSSYGHIGYVCFAVCRAGGGRTVLGDGGRGACYIPSL